MKLLSLPVVLLCCLPLLSLSNPILRKKRQLISELAGNLCDPRGAVPAPSNCPGVRYGRDVRLSLFSFGPNVCAIQNSQEVANVEYRYEIVTATGAKGITGTTVYCLPKCLSGRRPSSHNPLIRSRCCDGYAYEPAKRGCSRDLKDVATTQPTTQPTTAQPTTAQPTTAQPTTAQPTTAQPTTAQPTTAQPTTAQPTTAQPTTAQPTTAQPTTAEPTTVAPTAVEEDMSKLVGECQFFSFGQFHGTLSLKQEDALSETEVFGSLRSLSGDNLDILVHENPDISNFCANIGGFFPRIGSIASVRSYYFGYYYFASGKTVIPVSLLIGRSLSIVDSQNRIRACCAVDYPM